MAEKKCPQCAMMIPAEAKVCGHCRYKFPTGRGWKVFLLLVGLFLLLAIIINSAGGPSGQPKYTSEQAQVAEDALLAAQATGVVTSYKTEGSLQIVYVEGRFWRDFDFEFKKKFLGDMSELHEISGRSPWIEIRDHRSGEVYGELKPPLTREIYK